ncbi:MAG: PD40 domain-containing protein, partial [Nitrospira sp.]|nr:PD40 domain-containing protein [Nitrospira sp.]
METQRLRLHLCLLALTFLLPAAVTFAMSGMDMPHTGHEKGTSSLSQNIGTPINSSEAEIEITYSADGKTAIFASGRKGSVPSPGVPYNFDIWMAHNVNGTWQEPIHLGPSIDPTVGPNINTSAWELEPSLSEDGNVIYFTRYQPGNLSTGDLYVTQKINGVWQPARNWNDVPELPHINTPTGEEHCPIIASDSL